MTNVLRRRIMSSIQIIQLAHESSPAVPRRSSPRTVATEAQSYRGFKPRTKAERAVRFGGRREAGARPPALEGAPPELLPASLFLLSFLSTSSLSPPAFLVFLF